MKINIFLIIYSIFVFRSSYAMEIKEFNHNCSVLYQTESSKTIKEIQENATQIETLINCYSAIKDSSNNAPAGIKILSILFTPNVSKSISAYPQLLEYATDNNKTQYSVLGITTIIPNKTTLFKKNLIQIFIDAKIPIKPKDYECALLEKFSRCKSLMQKIYLIDCIFHTLNILPDELIKIIELKIFNSEQSLL